ncbi:MAG: S41 family peptidase [Bacteroidota bacterium]
MMNTNIKLLFLSLLMFAKTLPLIAQEETITEAFKESTIQSLNQMLNQFYVFPELALESEEHVNQLWEAGHFDQYSTLEAFADALTESVREVTHDKHIMVEKRMTSVAPVSTLDSWMAQKVENQFYQRRYNSNFKSVTKLEGNVGVLDLRGFYNLAEGKKFADLAMAQLATSDAIVIDLRNNSGGRPEMIFYLIAHFFNEQKQLSSAICRRGDEFTKHEGWSFEEIAGKRMPDVPLFLVTSSTTFSAAEGFSYDLQVYDRATIVGEITKGGANPGGFELLNEKLQVFIPDCRVVNHITNSNWEGVGVIPDVKIDAEQAIDKAIELAQAAAKEFRAKPEAEYQALIAEMKAVLDNFEPGKSESVLEEKLTQFHTWGLINEDEINAWGYEYLLQRQEIDIALVIMKTNISLYPKSANIVDSYAEALMTKGELEAALIQYEKAVALAEEQGDPNLTVFQTNLANLKQKMKAKD